MATITINRYLTRTGEVGRRDIQKRWIAAGVTNYYWQQARAGRQVKVQYEGGTTSTRVKQIWIDGEPQLRKPLPISKPEGARRPRGVREQYLGGTTTYTPSGAGRVIQNLAAGRRPSAGPGEQPTQPKQALTGFESNISRGMPSAERAGVLEGPARTRLPYSYVSEYQQRGPVLEGAGVAGTLGGGSAEGKISYVGGERFVLGKAEVQKGLAPTTGLTASQIMRFEATKIKKEGEGYTEPTELTYSGAGGRGYEYGALSKGVSGFAPIVNTDLVPELWYRGYRQGAAPSKETIPVSYTKVEDIKSTDIMSSAKTRPSIAVQRAAGTYTGRVPGELSRTKAVTTPSGKVTGYTDVFAKEEARQRKIVEARGEVFQGVSVAEAEKRGIDLRAMPGITIKEEPMPRTRGEKITDYLSTGLSKITGKEISLGPKSAMAIDFLAPVTSAVSPWTVTLGFDWDTTRKYERTYTEPYIQNLLGTEGLRQQRITTAGKLVEAKEQYAEEPSPELKRQIQSLTGEYRRTSALEGITEYVSRPVTGPGTDIALFVATAGIGSNLMRTGVAKGISKAIGKYTPKVIKPFTKDIALATGLGAYGGLEAIGVATAPIPEKQVGVALFRSGMFAGLAGGAKILDRPFVKVKEVKRISTDVLAPYTKNIIPKEYFKAGAPPIEDVSFIGAGKTMGFVKYEVRSLLRGKIKTFWAKETVTPKLMLYGQPSGFMKRVLSSELGRYTPRPSVGGVTEFGQPVGLMEPVGDIGAPGVFGVGKYKTRLDFFDVGPKGGVGKKLTSTTFYSDVFLADKRLFSTSVVKGQRYRGFGVIEETPTPSVAYELYARTGRVKSKLFGGTKLVEPVYTKSEIVKFGEVQKGTVTRSVYSERGMGITGKEFDVVAGIKAPKSKIWSKLIPKGLKRVSFVDVDVRGTGGTGGTGGIGTDFIGSSRIKPVSVRFEPIISGVSRGVGAGLALKFTPALNVRGLSVPRVGGDAIARAISTPFSGAGGVSLPRTLFDVGGVNVPRIGTGLGADIISKPISDVIGGADVTSGIGTGTVGATRTGTRTTPSTFSPVTPPVTPTGIVEEPIPLIVPPIALGGARAPINIKFPRFPSFARKITAYTPSLAGLKTKAKGKRPRVWSGVEVRPVWM